MSVDLDLFGNKPFENRTVTEALKAKFQEKFVVEEKQPRIGIFGYIDEVKIDVIRHPHPLIRPETTEEGIRFFFYRRYYCHESTSHSWPEQKERLLGYCRAATTFYCKRFYTIS